MNEKPTWTDCVKYYNHPKTRIRILKAYNDGKGNVNREGAFMGATAPYRFFKFSGYKFWDFAMSNFIVPKHCGVFKSMLEISMPNVAPNEAERKRQQHEFLTLFENHHTGTPYCIDIDVKEEKGGLLRALYYAKSVVRVLEARSIPYTLKFSGSRGFHIEVSWVYVKEKIASSPVQAFNLMKDWAMEISNTADVPFSVGFGCDSAIYGNKRQLWRTEWSVHPKTLCVAKLIEPEYLDHFKIEDFYPQNVLREIK